ncbi:MAG: hypothetical protein HC895_22120 [Leptolyngbyaceae cyanobacterium SM1_3_5]|nr:hypothetical protein [Leptolyngbyaceae cyanobacterium SM1_3_5]
MNFPTSINFSAAATIDPRMPFRSSLSQTGIEMSSKDEIQPVAARLS